MKVVNIHERELKASAEEVGALIDSLASARDGLWPKHSWPPMKFDHPVVLRHTLRMSTRGPALLSWPLVFRPLHDALIEDSLATAEASLGQPTQIQPWSAWVKFLRWMATGGKTRPQSRVGPKPN